MSRRLHDLLFAALLLALVALLAFFSTRWRVEGDWSHAQRGSLSAQSVELLRRLDRPVRVVSYASQGGELRQAIADFVARYQRVKPDIALEFIDPDADPAAMRREGVRIDGELDLHYGERSERLKVLTEREFSNALLRLSRSHTRIAAFLIGDGERRADGAANADFATFAALLAQQGVRSVPLALGSGARVPENTDLVVVADPRAALGAGAREALQAWLDGGGNLLWLTEPDSAADTAWLAQALSVRVLPGVAVDGAGAAQGLGDPSFVLITHYPAQAATRGFELATLYPQASALGLLAGAAWDAKPLLRTSAQSWTELGHIPKAGEAAAAIRFDADAGEIRGPLDLGFALSRLSPSPAKREQRAAALGDADFLSNAYLGNGGNREFGQRLFNWLLADDALIEVPDRGAPDRSLDLSQRGLGAISLGFLVLLPLLLLAAGGLIAWRRQRR
ncbi:MAG: Gldg family protein [Lysobacterales bacterium]